MQVQSSAFGWDHVIPSVVQMGFIFIESCTATRLSSSDDARRTLSGSETQELGLQMLITAFKVHEMARDEVRILHASSYLLLIPLTND